MLEAKPFSFHMDPQMIFWHLQVSPSLIKPHIMAQLVLYNICVSHIQTYPSQSTNYLNLSKILHMFIDRLLKDSLDISNTPSHLVSTLSLPKTILHKHISMQIKLVIRMTNTLHAVIVYFLIITSFLGVARNKLQ